MLTLTAEDVIGELDHVLREFDEYEKQYEGKLNIPLEYH